MSSAEGKSAASSATSVAKDPLLPPVGSVSVKLPVAYCSEKGCGETDPRKLIEVKTVYDAESGKTASEYRCSRHVTFEKAPESPPPHHEIRLPDSPIRAREDREESDSQSDADP